MRSNIFAILAGLIGVLSSLPVTIAAEPNVGTVQVSVSQISRGEAIVVGLLRKPLGTQTVISAAGKSDPGADEAKRMIIDRIDVMELSAGVELEIRGAQIRPGERYSLEGYESGEFYAPDGGKEGEHKPMRFRSFFVVTKVLEPDVAGIEITFEKNQKAPPEGVPLEARRAGITPAPASERDASTKIEFGEVKDTRDHGPLSKLAVPNISALHVTWADPAKFKDNDAIAEFLRNRLKSDQGRSFTFEVWSQGLLAPILAADVEHRTGKSGKLFIWPSGEHATLLVYCDSKGIWWFGDWND